MVIIEQQFVERDITGIIYDNYEKTRENFLEFLFFLYSVGVSFDFFLRGIKMIKKV